ncbi:hypothetical protein AB0M92_18915 [Streptomyces sp. NPDC051582]|uniref:hypothetical protein n=1 Tax=Streptomyces sp. NPDC051582 TaxID=3155167 RepID=UPI0034345B9C
MNPSLEAAADNIRDTLDAITDPSLRYEGLVTLEALITTAIQEARRKIAHDLHAEGRSWRKVGEVMGGVSPQRAHQISRGK